MKCNFIDTQHLDDQKLSTCMFSQERFIYYANKITFLLSFQDSLNLFFFPVSAVSKLLTFDTVCTSELFSFYCGE